MKNLFVLLFFGCMYGVQAQNPENAAHFTQLITEVKGDLNKDKIPDKVTVHQDTIAPTAPYKIQVFFGTPNGEYALVVASTQAIEPQYLNGRNSYVTGSGFYGLTLKKGVLTITYELLRGHIDYKFRFQNGNFELIGYYKVYSDGQGSLTYTDFNLSTGIRHEKTDRYDTDHVVSTSTKQLTITPLPLLQNLIPFENDWE